VIDVRTILVVRFGRLGDVLLAAAATRELKAAYPDARLDAVVHTRFAEAAALLPGVDRVIPFRGGGLFALRHFRRTDLAPTYDLVIDLQASPRSRLLCALVGGQVLRVRRSALRRRLLIRGKIGRRGAWPPVWRRYLETVERAGVSVRAEPPRLKLPGGGEAALTGAVAFAPGAGRPTKQWPVERFGDTARQIAEKIDRPILMVGSEKERDLLETAARRAGGSATVRAGGPLAETASILAASALLVTNDSGLLHLAAGVGTPVVALFGPTSKELGFPPPGEKDIIVERDLPCRPCSPHGTARCPVPRREHECLRGIGTERVVAAALRILRDSPVAVR